MLDVSITFTLLSTHIKDTNQALMSDKVRKITKKLRIEVPVELHQKISDHQMKIIGERRQKVTLADACVDLLLIATN